ncbi:MAG: MCP four helix bundle domain-containing protein, partial [Proteobacteria bacterium]|nr:MCP four helix bundle domain-containing protein [Pseudomonadota bacterium]
EQALPHVERIEALDGVVDAQLAQIERSVQDAAGRQAVQGFKDALRQYRQVRSRMLQQARAGDLAWVRTIGIGEVRPAYKGLKDAYGALARVRPTVSA